ncbi:MAG: universal stress protein, partial [Alphaproteobacteria bacterium RIFOXYD12_FULL_60_8]
MTEVRTFLVVVDNSEEMRAALRYACRRARATGGKVALLHVAEPAEFQHFAAIGDLMRQEARQEAEEILQRLASEVHNCSGQFPVLHMREGKRDEELFKLVEEFPDITILVLAAGTGNEGPGPIISKLTSKKGAHLRIPF